MSRDRILQGCAVALAMVAMLTSSAAAGPSSTAVLEADDLPGSYESGGPPMTTSTGMQIVIDGDACSQQLGPIDGLTELVVVQFLVPTSGESALSEAVTTFPDAKAAKASFKQRSKGAAAAVKCDTVDVISDGATVATLVYEKVKFPKVGKGSSAWHASGANNAEDKGSVTIAFLSGNHVVFLNTFGHAGSPTLKQMKTIARRAERLLRD